MDKKTGIKFSKSSHRRDVIVEIFTSGEDHLTVDELYEKAKKADPKVGYTTVWRTLKALEARGVAVSRKFNDGFTRYEYIREEKHHDHLICVECGHVEEFLSPKVEDIQKKIASKHGFTITTHKMELYGYCKKCGKHK